MRPRRVCVQILAALETAVNHPAAAQQYRQQAQEIITYIADHAGSNELRASFLALPAVQRLSAEKV